MLRGILVQNAQNDKSNYVVIELAIDWRVGGKPFRGTLDAAIAKALKIHGDTGKPLTVTDGTGITVGQVRNGDWYWSGVGRLHFKEQSEVYA